MLVSHLLLIINLSIAVSFFFFFSEQVHMAWSDSESNSKDESWVDPDIEHKSDESDISTKVISKDEKKMLSMIWVI